MTSIRCPILRGAIQQCSAKEPLPIPETDLLSIQERAIADNPLPDLIRIRGFLAIHCMVHWILSPLLLASFDHAELRLDKACAHRSWEGLQRLLGVVQEIMTEHEISYAQQRLAGLQPLREWEIRYNLTRYTRDRSEIPTNRLAHYSQLIFGVCELIVDSIEALRPYLKNENVSVSCIGRNLIRSLDFTFRDEDRHRRVLYCLQRMLLVRP